MKDHSITHHDLCRRTGERFHRESDITLIDFKVMGISENPDVLCFKNSRSTLYEIKVSRSDFKADSKKESRLKYKVKYWPYFNRHNSEIKKIIWGKPELSEFIMEYPHLGVRRYYVCPKDLIEADEVGSWGLYYYYESGRFRKIRDSSLFRRDLFLENTILVNAVKFKNHPNGDYDKADKILCM